MAIELEDGTILRSLPEQVSKNEEDIEDLQTNLSALDSKVTAALAGVFHYKGSVATYGDLPATDNEVGDVWNVLTDGKNYAWSGTTWDDLGGIVNLSNYVTLDSEQTITGKKIISYQNSIEYTCGLSGYKAVTDAASVAYRVRIYNGSTVVGGFSSDYTALWPALDAAIDLGGSTHAWKDLILSGQANVTKLRLRDSSNQPAYITHESSGIVVDKSVCPSITNTDDLGSATYTWKDAYLSGALKYPNFELTEDSGYFAFKKSGSNCALIGQTKSSFREIDPAVNNYYDLGSSSLNWKNLYLSGRNIIKSPDTSDTSGLLIENTYGNVWKFNVNQFSDLRISYGTEASQSLVYTMRTNYFVGTGKDLGNASYLWKDLYLSGNISDGTNSVTVADLKALIDYAKAQGWIS